jgi:predicted porin
VFCCNLFSFRHGAWFKGYRPAASRLSTLEKFSMKKTLIALAVIAVSGTAFAQSTVNLTGKFGAAYTSNKSAAGAKTNGFGVTDGDVVFTAVEDLGGGMKASASIALKARGRDSAVTTGVVGATTTTTTSTTTSVAGAASNTVGGRDASVSLMGGFGTVTLGAIEAGNGIIGLASAGAPVIGQDNGVTLDGAANVDLFAYTTPALIPGLTAKVLLIDSIGNPGTAGAQSAAATQDATLIGVNYGAGALAVAADYTAFGQNAAAATGTDSRTRISASYDLGVAKLGAGFQSKESFAGVKDTQYMLGVSAPMGPVLLGATYAVRNNDVAAVDAKGFELGAGYSFSKRTTLQTAYLSQKINGGTAATSLRVRLMHAF